MKKLLFLTLLLAQMGFNSFAQDTWYLTFDDTTHQNRLIIDTNNNPSNIWQIAQPNKAVFNTAYSSSSPNVIITDSINTYPTNDTSSFTIIHIAQVGWTYQYSVGFGGYYYANSDTLTDYGYFDISPDMGNTWYKADSILGPCEWSDHQVLPTFSGNTNAWKYFFYCITPPVQTNYGDTILYRFTFISDSNQTNKDGIMFDDLRFTDRTTSIPEIENENLVKIYPNPTNRILYIKNSNITKAAKIQIYNSMGELLYEDASFNKEYIDVKAINLKEGIYFLRYYFDDEYTVKSFIVQD